MDVIVALCFTQYIIDQSWCVVIPQCMKPTCCQCVVSFFQYISIVGSGDGVSCNSLIQRCNMLCYHGYDRFPTLVLGFISYTVPVYDGIQRGVIDSLPISTKRRRLNLF